jgi:glutaminyl-tRNA synthetase
VALLEHFVRAELNRRAERRMAVLKPLKVVIENYPDGEVEELQAINNPEDSAAGSRTVPFSRELYIERDDFRSEPPSKYFRLAPGREVRLRWGYFIRCVGVIPGADGEPAELRCTYDRETRGGQAPDGRKVKGTIHWVSAAHSVPATVRLYDHLFLDPDAENVPETEDFLSNLNPRSMEVLEGCRLEPGLAGAEPGSRWQFERQGYFCADEADSLPGAPVFNRTVTLKDTWAKIAAR